jgi:hypothetical protein
MKVRVIVKRPARFRILCSSRTATVVKPAVGFTLPWAGLTPAPSERKRMRDFVPLEEVSEQPSGLSPRPVRARMKVRVRIPRPARFRILLFEDRDCSETRRGFHASLGRGDPCTQYSEKKGCGTLSLLGS